jgi:hypothetical protein
MKKLFLLAFLTIISLTLVKYGGLIDRSSISVNAQVQVNSSIPTSLKSCLPKMIQSGYMTARVVDNQKTYYTLIWERLVPSEIFKREMEPVQELSVILEDELGCQVIVPPELGLTHSKALFLPQTVARQLELDKLQRGIALAGGKTKFQEELERSDEDADAATSPPLYFPEDKWAYEQLGLKLPKNAIIREIFKDEEIYKLMGL